MDKNIEGGIYPKPLPFAEYLDKIMEHFLRDDRYKIAMPKTISNTPDEPAFYHFDPATLMAGDWSEWADWMESMPVYARPVWMAWVYGVFVAENKGRLMVWLYGPGFDGKSVVLATLAEYMRWTGVASISQGSMDNQFGYAQCYGKRLLLYGDCKSPSFLRGTKAHSVTGGDYVPIEFKGASVFMH